MHLIAFPAFTSLQPSKTRATFSSSLRSSNPAVTCAILFISTSLSLTSPLHLSTKCSRFSTSLYMSHVTPLIPSQPLWKLAMSTKVSMERAWPVCKWPVNHIVEHTSCRWQSCFHKRVYTAKELVLIFCTSTVCGRWRLPLEHFHWLWMPSDHSAVCAEKRATCCSATPFSYVASLLKHSKYL